MKRIALMEWLRMRTAFLGYHRTNGEEKSSKKGLPVKRPRRTLYGSGVVPR